MILGLVPDQSVVMARWDGAFGERALRNARWDWYRCMRDSRHTWCGGVISARSGIT